MSWETRNAVIVTIGDNRDYIRILLYSYYTTITGWGVLLKRTYLLCFGSPCSINFVSLFTLLKYAWSHFCWEVARAAGFLLLSASQANFQGLPVGREAL